MIAQLGFDNLLLQLGVGGIFAILIIRMVFDFLNRKNGSGNTKVFDKRMTKVETDVDEIKDCVHKIHDMHDVKNADGVPVWYIPQSLVQTQKEVQETNLKIQETNLKVVAILKDLMKTVERLEKKVSKINK